MFFFFDLESFFFFIYFDCLFFWDWRVGMEGLMNEEVFIELFNLYNLFMKFLLEFKYFFDLLLK